jgi:hypothetical protein
MADVRVRWAYPTQRSDGSNLPLSDIRHLRLELSADGGQNYGVLRNVTPPTEEYVQTELTFGEWFFRGTIVDRFGQDCPPNQVRVGSIVVMPAPPGGVAELIVELA